MLLPAIKTGKRFLNPLQPCFSKNETIRFNIQYTKMLIMVEDKGPIKTSFNWDGEWLAVGELPRRTADGSCWSLIPEASS